MNRRHAWVIAALVLELGALAGIAALGDLRAHRFEFLSLFAVALTAFGGACILLRRLPVRLPAIALIMVVLRLPMLVTQPSLSDDVWRYLHDGRAQLAGISPYALAPADPRTLPFRGPEHGRINHPDLVTIYPPAAQLSFLLIAGFGASLLIWRLLLIAAELAAVAAVARLLARRGRRPANLALYAWHPLAIVEGIGSAHLEPIGIALLMLGVLVAHHRSALGGVLLGLSVGFKLVAAPLLAATDYVRNRRLMLAAAATLLLLYAIYWGGGSPFGSLPRFVVQWEANASLYALLAALTDGHRARIVAATLLLCVIVLIRNSNLSDEDRMAWCMTGGLLLSPVVHPWYVLWLLAFVPLMRQRELQAATLLWSSTIPLAYLQERISLIEYAPVYLLIGISLIRAARRGYRSETLRLRSGRMPRTGP